MAEKVETKTIEQISFLAHCLWDEMVQRITKGENAKVVVQELHKRWSEEWVQKKYLDELRSKVEAFRKGIKTQNELDHFAEVFGEQGGSVEVSH